MPDKIKIIDESPFDASDNVESDIFMAAYDESGDYVGGLDAAVTQKDDRLEAKLMTIDANPPERGTGSKLMKALVVELKARKVTDLWSDSLSEDALAMRLKVFGEELLHFYDPDHLEDGFLPMNIQQARSSRHRLDAYTYDNPDSLILGPGVYVDLSKVDSAEWHRPEKSKG